MTETPISYFKGNRNLKTTNVNIEYTSEQLEEFVKCANDPIYFTENYVKIVSLDVGLIQFKPYEFQKKLIKEIVENRFTIAKLPRQYGKTTAIVALMLWYILFHENFKISVLAHKEKQAMEIIDRIRIAYQHLPIWMQQGIAPGGWNKKSIELENGSKIDSSTTSENALRGESINFIYLDEFAHVPNNIAESFYTSVFPVITSGLSTKLAITSTPNGMNLFWKLWTDAEEKKNSFRPVEVNWNAIPGRDEDWRKTIISNTSERQFEQEFECNFLGSLDTLIDAKKLRMLRYDTPVESSYHVDQYEKPIENRTYILVADTSRGVSLDYSAFVVFDITEIPYKFVCKFRDNEISPLLYPNVIYSLAKHYNNAYVLVEINDNGQQIADILYNDLEYDNVLSTRMGGRNGQKLSGGFGTSKAVIGIRTTKQIKRIGCANLKSLIENDKLLLGDFDTIYELSRFVSQKGSYSAEEGEHDDLAMCLVLFAWLANQTYFKEFTDTDVRTNLYGNFTKELEEDMLPFGFIDYGNEEENSMSVTEWYDRDWGAGRLTHLEVSNYA